MEVANTIQISLSRHERRCAICLEGPIDHTLISTCNEHFECTGCIRQAFKQACKYETSFPPVSCCGQKYPLSIKHYYFLFDDDFVEKFEAATAEYQTPHATRTYCAIQSCSKFLQTAPGDGFAKCSACKIITCRFCAQPANDIIKHRCSGKSNEDKKLSLLARMNGWKACPGCTTIIELREACNHVECVICKFEFCFACKKPWEGQHDCPLYGQPKREHSQSWSLNLNHSYRTGDEGADEWFRVATGFDPAKLELDQYLPAAPGEAGNRNHAEHPTVEELGITPDNLARGMSQGMFWEKIREKYRPGPGDFEEALKWFRSVDAFTSGDTMRRLNAGVDISYWHKADIIKTKAEKEDEKSTVCLETLLESLKIARGMFEMQKTHSRRVRYAGKLLQVFMLALFYYFESDN